MSSASASGTDRIGPPRDDVIAATFARLRGRPCWGLAYQRMLNLSMSFGRPSLSVREPVAMRSRPEAVRDGFARRLVTVRGQWWLWVYLCHWRISCQGRRLATGASSLRDIQRALARLGGQRLVSAEVAPATGATRFAFDLGGALECRRRWRDSDDELWTLYTPGGYALAVPRRRELRPRSSHKDRRPPAPDRPTWLR